MPPEPSVPGLTIRLGDREDIKARVATLQKELEQKKKSGESLVTPRFQGGLTSGADRIHTFETDTNEEIQKKGLSAASIFAQESDRGTAPRPTRRKPFPLVPVALGVLLLVLGVGIVGMVYYLTIPTPPAPEEARVETPITVNQQVKLSKEAFFDDVRSTKELPLTEGVVELIYSVESLGDGTERIVGLDEVFESLGAPPLFIRSIAPGGMLGLYGEEDGPSLFFLIPTSSFERSFRGMLGWEATVADRARILFGDLDRSFPIPEPVVTGTTTPATTTPVLTETRVYSPVFKDKIVQNVDVRVLNDAKSRVYLMYGFPRKDMLLIAESEAAFREAVMRLSRE
jgi:hypothetical protein